MPSLVAVLQVAVFCAVALASPTSNPGSPRGLALPFYRRPRSSPAHTLRRRSLAVRQNAASNGKGYLPMVDQDEDGTYYAPIELGTPAQALNVTLDTGSSDLWVLGASCNDYACDGAARFNPSASSSYHALGQDVTYLYGVPGQFSNGTGPLGTDVMTMAGYTLTGQTFGTLFNASEGLVQGPDSGLLGLCYGPPDQSDSTPFWVSLMGARVLPEPLFAFYFARFSDIPNVVTDERNGGILTLGYTNETLYTGDITYMTANTTTTAWMIPLDAISVGSYEITVSGAEVIVDTGTSGIGVPPTIARDIFSQIPGSAISTDPNFYGFYTYPCRTNVTLSFTFSGRTFPVDASDFILEPLDQSGTKCYSTMFEIDDGTDSTWLIGDVFMKNVYTVFRYQPPSVGFATLSTTAVHDQSLNPSTTSPAAGTASTPSQTQKSAATIALGRAYRLMGAVLTISSCILLFP